MTYMSSPLVVAPAAVGTIMGALFLYAHLTDDPLFESATSISGFFLADAPPVRAKITMADGLTAEEEAEFKDQLENAFAAKGVPMKIQINRDSSLDNSSVSFSVGPTKIGPMPLRDAAEGVSPAAEAYRMGL